MVVAAALGLLIGAVIGGLGGGGGVLTVPVLVYLLGQDAQDATTSSVIIVGVAAVVGVLARGRGDVAWRTGIALGLVGIPAAYLGTLLNRHVGEPVLLIAFAVLTLMAAVAMLLDSRARRGDDGEEGSGSGRATASVARHGRSPGGAALAARAPAGRGARLLVRGAKVVLCGVAVGFLTGFLGVGGGFLLVPALVIVLDMPIALAAGTSLLVIVLNSISSLVSRIGDLHLDWQVVAPFTLAAVVGTLAGKRIADRLSGATLGKAFAVLLLAVGAFVGVQSILAL
ncbi:sulfite exporter TauE/SafE family protein [Pseudonocardia sp. RS010]|uniref:sulfite exporter TauE/SafE family protein n=1 Tax=Pseudonocardia sp. RS010 TaxID=3385979 RepID=UPI0039A158D7